MALAVSAAPAAAPTRHFAIVVGSDASGAARQVLRFAERDAARLGRALTEVGEVAPADVQLLQGRKVADLEAAFAKTKERIAEFRRASGARALLIFYFAGRADAATFALGAERLPAPRVKALLLASGADVRLGLFDEYPLQVASDDAGAAPAGFTLKTDDRLSTAQEAFLTSMTADEASPQASALGGGAFSHQLVAGLRGAADRSGDQQVSLDELVRYAARAGASPQSPPPGAGFRLSTQGDLMLSNVRRARTAIELPDRAEWVTLSEGDRGEVVAQLDGAAARVLAIPAGRYAVRARRDGRTFTGRFTLDEGVRGALGWDELRPERAGADEPGPNDPGRWATASLVPITGEAAPSAPPVGMLVLPFQVPRGEASLEALSQAITQAVAAEVTRVESVHVFRNNGVRIDGRDLAKLAAVDILAPEAREKLRAVPGAELVVMGLLSRSGDLLNATAYLIDVATGRVLDTAHGARPRSAPAGLGEELARETSAGLRTALERRRPR
jgi:TolB-like protein